MLDKAKEIVISFILEVMKLFVMILVATFVLMFLIISMTTCIILHVYQAVAMKFQR